MSDPVLLQRVLLNLVNNAIKYTAQGTVLVCCRPARQGRQAQIQVWDSGIGIDAPLHQSVFEEFFQVANPERDHTKGLGLGLSMVDRSCRLLRHPVALRSALGCGSRFTVHADASAPRPIQPPPAAPDDTLDGAPVQGREIWLIEDNPLGGQALQGLLQSWGCTTRLFENLALARQAVEAGEMPDFLISDYRLREQETGITAILTLRELLQRKVPACLMTGDLQEEVLHQAQSAGLVLLKKPVQPAKLRSLLRRSLLAASP